MNKIINWINALKMSQFMSESQKKEFAKIIKENIWEFASKLNIDKTWEWNPNIKKEQLVEEFNNFFDKLIDAIKNQDDILKANELSKTAQVLVNTVNNVLENKVKITEEEAYIFMAIVVALQLRENLLRFVDASKLWLN